MLVLISSDNNLSKSVISASLMSSVILRLASGESLRLDFEEEPVVPIDELGAPAEIIAF